MNETESEITLSACGRWVNIDKKHDYEIDLNRIKTERDLLAWVAHLTEKSWVTTTILGKFIKLVAEKKGLNVHGL